MSTWTLLLRSLRFHARSHLGALLGAAVGTAVLVGALVVGDSVRGSLRDMALARLGSIQWAMAANDRTVRAQLADDLAKSLGAPVAPVVQLEGTAATLDGSARAIRVQVLGVTDPFWQLGLQPATFTSPGPEQVVLNRPLANQLHAKVGDTILLRVGKPSALSREAPISPQEDFAVALRLVVQGVAPDEQMGRFSLKANQVPPFTAFLSGSWLGDKLQMPGRANLLLVGKATTPGQPGSAEAALGKAWQLSDAELQLRELGNGAGLELRTSRVFLDPASAAAAMGASSNATGILTYFVNALRAHGRSTPYSMVTAMGQPVVPAEMKDNEILVNSWLADDLQLNPGDSLTLTYFVIGNGRRLQERTNQFAVRAIVPMTGPAADQTLMPDFPGLEKAESTRDWDSSLPIQLDRIRPKDETYWKDFRGTPKAFVTLAAGQKMWGNRFGDLTAVRYPAGTPAQPVRESILHALNPASLGLQFQPVRQQAFAASEQGQDFGQLFLGFSFFLIGAALLLMALLFQFGVEKRAGEVGTLLALGFTPKQVRRLLLGEGAVLALIGASIGVPGGMGYARAMVYGLSTIWRSAVGTSALQYHANGTTLMTGAVSGVAVAVLTIWFALRKQARQPACQLLAEGSESQFKLPSPGRRSRGIWIGWLTSALAMLLLGWAGMQARQGVDPEMFFMAGALLLVSGIAFAAAFFAAIGTSEAARQPSLNGLGVRNVSRRQRRSLATVGLLASGSFLVASIGVFKLDVDAQPGKRASGTGGFALIGESTLPIVQDLNSEPGKEFFGLSSNDLPDVHFVSFRVHDGEDASCLNLNRAQQPRLLGVRPELLRQRFVFSSTVKDSAHPWQLLDEAQSDGSVPAIGDAASIQWALGKSLGDTLTYSDERGHQFKIRLVGALANSILQGSLIISENELLQHFPSETGYRFFLIDAPAEPNGAPARVAVTLSRATQDYGMQLVSAWQRLAAFNAVQNTYLNTFQVLGGLGLILGSIGLGVVVLRNVLERRGELALLTAVGFRRRALQWIVLSEHGALLLIGLLIGVLAAFVAVLPTLLSPRGEFPFRSLALTLGVIFVSGALWTWFATLAALRGRLLDALRND
jgi:putative ABC transport system permease protein